MGCAVLRIFVQSVYVVSRFLRSSIVTQLAAQQQPRVSLVCCLGGVGLVGVGGSIHFVYLEAQTRTSFVMIFFVISAAFGPI